MSTKKIFALLLALLVLVSVLASCHKTPDSQAQTTPQSTDQTTPQNTTPDQTETTTEPTTPNETTPEETTPEETPPKEPTDITLSSVKILAGDSTIETIAVAELEWYFAQKNISVSSKGYPITVSIDPSVAADGYKIEATKDGLTITGGTNRGLAYGIYNFLEKFAGVKFYAPNTIVTDDSDIVIAFGLLDEFTPAFEILRNPWQPIEALAEKNGGNIFYHDHLYKTLTLDTLTGGETTAQPCLSDTKNLSLAIENTKAFLAKYPGLVTLTFAPVPGTDKYCMCDDCSLINAEEGSNAGTYIRFINEIIGAVAPDYPNLGFGVEVPGYLQSAPAVTKPYDGVVIYISTAECHATHPITDENCPVSVAFIQKLQSWVDVSQVRLEYVVTSNDYIPTFPNFGALRENMRYFAESGIDSIYLSGNFTCPSGEFAELRAYLIAKLLQNPNMSEEEYSAHMNGFLSAYYGKGWSYIRLYIDKTTELANNQSTDNGEVCGQTVFDDALTVITREEYLNRVYVFENYWDAAEDLAGERADFVKRARLQWQYIQLCLTPNAKDANTLITTVSNAKIAWRESQWTVQAESNLDLSPAWWKYTR